MFSRVISSLNIFKKVGALQFRARWRAAAVFFPSMEQKNGYVLQLVMARPHYLT